MKWIILLTKVGLCLYRFVGYNVLLEQVGLAVKYRIYKQCMMFDLYTPLILVVYVVLKDASHYGDP